MTIRYRVELSHTEREELTALLSGGKQAARRLKQAQILLAADAGIRNASHAFSHLATSSAFGSPPAWTTLPSITMPGVEAMP
jgi:hypothetical protein